MGASGHHGAKTPQPRRCGRGGQCGAAGHTAWGCGVLGAKVASGQSGLGSCVCTRGRNVHHGYGYTCVCGCSGVCTCPHMERGAPCTSQGKLQAPRPQRVQGGGFRTEGRGHSTASQTGPPEPAARAPLQPTPRCLGELPLLCLPPPRPCVLTAPPAHPIRCSISPRAPQGCCLPLCLWAGGTS